MTLSVGIIGLPNAGKSTLFNALVKKQQAITGKHPFTTVEPNRGTVGVPSKRLDDLALMVQEGRRRPTLVKTSVKLTFVDIAGLIKGAYKGEGLGNQFLAHIREVDCFLHVVRKFEDPTIPHIHSDIDPHNDLEIVRLELILKDLETIEKQIGDKKGRWLRKKGGEGGQLLEKIRMWLNKGRMVRDLDLTIDEKTMIESLCLLTDKPEVIIWNIGEKETFVDPPPKIQNQDKYSSGRSSDVLTICAKLEGELAGLPWAEQRQYLKEFGLPEPALNRVIRACYKKLKLLTFYTIAGGKEARAWALEQGSTAYSAAGRIHTDMQKRFIKAEVINADKLLNVGSWSKAKQEGKIKLHGRDYIVKDHDVLEIKFN